MDDKERAEAGVTKRPAVVEVLQRFKFAVDFDRPQFLPRAGRDIDQDLANLNLTRKQALEHIKGLTPDNYSRGPEPDDHEPQRDVWVFGCDVEGTEVYIKLRLIEGKEADRCAIWSFHKAEHPLRYPLREGGS